MPRVHRHRLVKKPSSFFLSSRTSYLLSVLVSSATPNKDRILEGFTDLCVFLLRTSCCWCFCRAGSPRDGAGGRRPGGRRPDPSRGPPPGRRGRESRARSKPLGEHSIEKDDKGRGGLPPPLKLSLPISTYLCLKGHPPSADARLPRFVASLLHCLALRPPWRKPTRPTRGATGHWRTRSGRPILWSVRNRSVTRTAKKSFGGRPRSAPPARER